MKKFISLLTVTVLVLSIAAFSAFSDTVGGLSDRQCEAIAFMNDIGVFNGVSEEMGVYTVTRADFAKTVVGVMGAYGLPETARQIFTDVPADHSAAIAIEYLYERGIMSGFENAEFKPSNNITIVQAIKTTLCILGYSEIAAERGGYPLGYYSIAVANNLLKGIDKKIDDEMTYADMAVLLRNALEDSSFIVSGSYKNGYAEKQKAEGTDYLGYSLDIYKFTGLFEAINCTSIYDSAKELKTGVCEIGGEKLNFGDKNISQYLGMYVTAYYRKDGENANLLHITASDENDVIEINAEDIDKSTTKNVFKYNDGKRNKKLSIAANAIFLYNGKRLDYVVDSDLIIANGYIRLINNDGDSDYDVVIITEFETYIVDRAVAVDSLLYFKYDRGFLDLKEEGLTVARYFIDGAETEFSSIVPGSVLSVALSKNITGSILADIYISNNIVTGVAKVTDDEGVILEDGTQYDYTDEYISRINDVSSNSYAPIIGSEGDFYIDYFNKLAAFKLSTKSKTYGYVVKAYYNRKDGCIINMFTQDGTFVDYEVAEKVKYNGRTPELEEIPDILMQTGDNGTVNQLVVYKSNDKGLITEIKTAVDKTDEVYYVASDEEFVLNAHPKNDAGEPVKVRFYKNVAENRPFSFVPGKTLQFMIPTDKYDKKSYRIGTKLASTDVDLPAPLYIYDAGKAGAIGAVVSNSANEGEYSKPVIVDKVMRSINDEEESGILLSFIGGTSVFAGDSVIYDQPPESDAKGNNNWRKYVPEYGNIRISDLKRGDVIEYTTSNGQVDMLRVIVKADDIGPVRIDGDHIQLNGNMIADIISVAEDAKTALVYYVDRFGTERYQTMHVNSTVYRFDSKDNEVYISSTSDLQPGDRVLINSYWWSPNLVVIFR